MSRYVAKMLLVLVALTVAAPEVPIISTIAGVEAAQAQTKRKRKTLFDLFKTRRKSSSKKRKRASVFVKWDEARKKRREAARERRLRQQQAGLATASQTQAPTKVEKIENAGKILLIGDFMSSSLSKGLVTRYAENPQVIVVNKAVPSSGIVRDDVAEWWSLIPEMVADVQPIAIVALVGMNDRQLIRLNGEKFQKLDEKWLAEYNARVGKIASALKQSNVPSVWVGLPPVRSTVMNTDYLAFNEIYRTKAEAAGINYVDVWDGFTNAEGKFVSAGPDINGQIVRLRGSKGISMSRAGREKLAFFADGVLRSLGVVQDPRDSLYASLGLLNPQNAQPRAPDYDPAKSGKTVILSLGSPGVDGGNTLEGEEGFLTEESLEKANNRKLVQNGLALTPQLGRVDENWGAVEVPLEEAPTEEVKAN